ncbi:hypothetical protein TNCV_4940981 [Trichonephila clavipes]|nr:hypothetical protein TNCV_4940981 [Trichonephila clavipes]
MKVTTYCVHLSLNDLGNCGARADDQSDVISQRSFIDPLKGSWLLLRWIDGTTIAVREECGSFARPGSPMKEGRFDLCTFRSERVMFGTSLYYRHRQNDRLRVIFSSGLDSTAADSVRSGWPLWHSLIKNTNETAERVEEKQKL